MRLNRAGWLIAAMVLVAAAAAASLIRLESRAPATSAPAQASAKAQAQPMASPPARVCGNRSILASPYSYHGAKGTFTVSGTPSGLPTFGSPGTDFPSDTRIVVIPTGDNTPAANTGAYQANNTVFYFEPGMHIIQAIMYTGDGSAYIGGYTSAAGAAIINGVNGAAQNGLGGSYLSLSRTGNINADETWEYLTIENYAASENGAVIGNENGAAFDSGNTYKYDTIGPDEYGYADSDVAPRTGESNGGGYAIGLVSNTTIEYDCLTRNAQGAFNGGGENDIISHNEISWNGLGEYPDIGGPGGSPYSCGCSGGGKLFFSVNATVTYNYVHNNYNTGIWLDFDNTGANISHNYVASNWGGGITYEASYNANISYNTLVGNGWASDGSWPAGVDGKACYGGVSCTDGEGPITGAGGRFPYAAIYLPNSGGNGNLGSITINGCNSGCKIDSDYRGELLVRDNVLRNNFGGVMVYTDTNRYPGNIDNDSACSVPLGSLDQPNSTTYYLQTGELYITGNAAISGTSVTSTTGTTTLCSNYGGPQRNGTQSNVTRAPSIGMAVFNISTGDLIGTVASVTNARAFTLKNSAADASHVSLLLSSYGGCGPADYYGGGPGKESGEPAAHYWDNCIWGSRNVSVSGNVFSMQAGSIIGCTIANMCGFTADIAFNAGTPALMRFFDSYPSLIADATGGLGNAWSHNSYSWSGPGPGRWQFWAGLQGNQVTQRQWTSPPYRQDAGSTFS